MKTTKLIIATFLGLSGVCMAAQALAAEYEAEVRAGVGISDNVGRTVDFETDETIATVGFDFAITEQSRRLELDLRSNLDYFDYVDDTFDAEVVGGIVGEADFTLVEEHLEWIVRDNFGQQLTDPLEAARPGNREDINYFETGPTLTLHVGDRNFLTLDGRYSSVQFEENPFDNDRLSGMLSIGRETSRYTTLSLNVFTERAEFDDGDLVPDTDRAEAYLNFRRAGARTVFDLELGYSEVEHGSTDGDGILLRIDFTRETSPNGTFRASAGSHYSDQGNIFREYQDLSTDLRETTDGAVSPAPFQNDFVAIGYSLEHTRSTFGLTFDWSREDYEGDLGVDRDVFHGAAYFQRDLSRSVFAGANARFYRREFDELGRRDDELIFILNIGYRFSPGFSVVADYQHWQRNSVSGFDFTENRVFLRATYTPVWSRPGT